ncbi:TPA: hypothetical protein ACS7XC_001541 [Providencia alcalifaciens]
MSCLLLLKTRPQIVIPELAVRLGLSEALLLQQVQYWLSETASGIEHKGRRWIYNTIEEWREQFPYLSESTIKRAFTNLKKLGVLSIEQINKHNHDRTNYYSINYEHTLLSDEVNLTSSNRSPKAIRTGQNDLIDKRKMKRSERVKMTSSNGSNWSDLTESTTENTTEITTESNSSCPDASQPDELKRNNNLDDEFLKRHPDAVVFSIKKRQWGSIDDLTCAKWIWQKVLALYEQAAESDGELSRPKEPNWVSWANEIRLMCTLDNRTHRQICELFSRANRDPFWCRNVLSPTKLREQWDHLTLKFSNLSVDTTNKTAGYEPLDFESTDWLDGIEHRLRNYGVLQ